MKAPIAAKASEGALRASARRVAGVFDRSVPTSERYRGLAFPAAHAAVRISASAELSPFILRLAPDAPTPEAILDAAEPAVLLNFLAGNVVSLTPATIHRGPTDDLTLAPHEIAAQLAENVASVSWMLPRLHIVRPAAVSLPVPSDPIAEPLSISDLSPEGGAARLRAALDLPEAEDEPESALVEFVARDFKRRSWPSLALPLGWERAVGAFALLAFAFVLPLHAMTLVGGLRSARDTATAVGTAAVSQLNEAAGAVAAQDPGRASASFNQATERFQAAQRSVSDIGGAVALVASALPRVGSQVRAGTRLLAAGAALSQAGARLSDGFAAVGASASSPTARLTLLNDYASSALPFLDEASRQIAGVRPSDVPAAERDTFASLSPRLPEAVAGLKQFLSLGDALIEILGGNGTRTYLVIFQNENELRPTGGFMGSFAELSVRNGNIVGMDIPGGGTYDVRGALKTFTAAPDPLRLLSARFEFQDANWFPDFPTSARKILSFYADAGGPTVDGVIAVNAREIAELLAILGPIDMPAYGRTITQENFVAETQKIVEHEYDRVENKPKAFIGDLAPKLLDRVASLSGGDFLGVLAQASQGLEEKNVQVYFADNALEKLVRNLGWDGGVKQTDGDYLMPVDTNLGGGKSDGVIAENVDVLVNVASDGTVTDTVTVTRTHQGSPSDPSANVNNVNYLRLYVPNGSRLLHASGFDAPEAELFETPETGWKIDDDVFYDSQTASKDAGSGTDVYEESGKTVFGNWMQVKPGATASATFTYRLPFKVVAPADGAVVSFLKRLANIPRTARYTLTVQKQSGVANRTTHVRVEFPDALSALWSSQNPQALIFDNARDAFFAALLEPK